MLPNRHKVPGRKFGAKMATKLIPSNVFNVVYRIGTMRSASKNASKKDARRDMNGNHFKDPCRANVAAKKVGASEAAIVRR